MKVCTEGFEFITQEEMLEEALLTLHRFKPEPNFSKTGVGSMLPASTEERANEAERLSASVAKIEEHAKQNGVSFLEGILAR